MKYNSEALQSKQTGAGASRWKYWKIFSLTFPKDRKIVMSNVHELGDREFQDPELEPEQIQKQHNDKKDLKELKVNTLTSLNRLIEKDLRSIDSNETIEKRLKKLEQRSKKSKKVVKRKLDAIIDLLNKRV